MEDAIYEFKETYLDPRGIPIHIFEFSDCETYMEIDGETVSFIMDYDTQTLRFTYFLSYRIEDDEPPTAALDWLARQKNIISQQPEQ